MRETTDYSIVRRLLTLALLLLAQAGLASAPSFADDGVSAGLIASEIRALGYAAKIDKDDSGDPRVNTAVDGYDWAVYFYNCGSGALEERTCRSFQFYSGYSTRKAVPLQTINKWNTEIRYAKAYNYMQRNGPNSRIEIDVQIAGTSADAAQSFRTYFDIMKSRAADFRKRIGFVP
jgi:hypothetical protein